jgi:putative ABC transport system ATP-binding protein
MSKSEINAETDEPKIGKSQNIESQGSLFGTYFGHLKLFRISDFVLRVSVLAPLASLCQTRFSNVLFHSEFQICLVSFGLGRKSNNFSSRADLTRAQSMEEKVAIGRHTAGHRAEGDVGVCAVELKNVEKTYRTGPIEIPALRGVSLRIAPGEFLAVAGPSGSGKTTLLNIIGGLDRADAGEVWVEGNNLQLLSSGELARMRLERLGFVFQAYNLLPVLTAMENAEFTLLLQGVPVKKRKATVQKLFLEIGLAGLENRRPAELSGGQQQRVAVARAMVTEPALILADEPTANLDSATGAALLDVMEQLNRAHNTTFIFSTHDPQVMERAHRWIRLRDGQIASDAAHASHILPPL